MICVVLKSFLSYDLNKSKDSVIEVKKIKDGAGVTAQLLRARAWIWHLVTTLISLQPL